MNARWRHLGKAYRLTDDYSTLWIRRIGREFHLLHRTRDGWATLGVHATLKGAQEDGSALMGVTA
jgi:hypothetical protein